MKLSTLEQALIRSCGTMTMQRSTAKNQNTVRALVRKGLAKLVGKNDGRNYVELTMTGARVLNALRNRPTPEIEVTAKEHKAADVACGRSWVCACAACRMVRGAIR